MKPPIAPALTGRALSVGGPWQEPDTVVEPLAILCAAVRAVAEEAAEPEVLIGALLESAVHVAHRHMPPERHDAVAWAMRRLLADRLDAHGLADSDDEVWPGCAVD